MQCSSGKLRLGKCLRNAGGMEVSIRPGKVPGRIRDYYLSKNTSQTTVIVSASNVLATDVFGSSIFH